MAIRVVSIRVGRFDVTQATVAERAVQGVLSTDLVRGCVGLRFEDFSENPYYVETEEALDFVEKRTRTRTKRIEHIPSGKYAVLGHVLIEDKSNSESDELVKAYLWDRLQASISGSLKQIGRYSHFLVEPEMERSPGWEGVDIREDRDEILRRAREAGSEGVVTGDPTAGLRTIDRKMIPDPAWVLFRWMAQIRQIWYESKKPLSRYSLME